MPFDSVIFKGYQDEAEDLEERIVKFLNLPPSKKVVNISAWVVGIEVYVMILFGRGKQKEEKEVTLKNLLDIPYGTYTGTIGDY